MLVDQPVALVVEVLRLQQIRYLVDSVVVDDQRAEHRLLGFDRMRRGAERLYVGIESHSTDSIGAGALGRRATSAMGVRAVA